jgi:hypothetical protein
MIRRVTLLGSCLVALASCLSPTLPLPPPDEPSSMSPSAEDPELWTISGDCPDLATVTITNEETGDGDATADIKADGTCGYSLTLVAQRCDLAKLTISIDGESSEIGFTVQETTNGTPVDMTACH